MFFLVKPLMILFAVLLLGTGWWLYGPNSSPQHRLTLKPDAYMNDIQAIIFDKAGHPKLKIVSSKMVHFIENDQTHFSNPTVTIYHDTHQPWFVQSDYAQTIHGLDKIFFWQHVTAKHLSNQTPTITIQTPQLTVDTQTQLATTKAIITLAQPNLIAKSIGMIANFKNNHVQLLSQTQAFYVPDEP